MMRYVLIGIASLALTACGSSDSASDPETELRAWVDRGEAAAESKDRGQLLDVADLCDAILRHTTGRRSR